MKSLFFGIPVFLFEKALRCSIWITSIVQATQPHQTERVIQEYGTLRKVSALDYAWEMLLKEMFPDASDEEDSFLIDFGLGKDLLNNQLLGGIDDGTNTPIPDKHDAEFGVRKLKRVLNAIQHVLNVEYCPLLPHITCIFLEFMSDSFAYASLREMINGEFAHTISSFILVKLFSLQDHYRLSLFMFIVFIMNRII